jgi:DNA invertase Pin-like site-specific DNA recombinase
MQEKLKCAIYTRVSTDNQAEIEFSSCEAQEEKIRAFIKSQDDMEVIKFTLMLDLQEQILTGLL